MADNVVLNPGVGGSSIATDNIDDIDYQRVKVNHGRDGETVDASWQDPLPTLDNETRRALELQSLAAHDAAMIAVCNHAGERSFLFMDRSSSRHGCR